MRLANGIVIDKEKTFGQLKFRPYVVRCMCKMRTERSVKIKERTYDLKCREQGRMIQVSVPANIPLRDFEYNAEVELVNPVADTVANATYRGADIDWYMRNCDDLVLKNKGQTQNNPNAAPKK